MTNSANLPINIIGAGLAGCEAAYQLLKRGHAVRLYEMRPHKLTPAHSGGGFAELVCSNSLRANNIENAVGLLKEEMRRCDSLIMQAADTCAVPAGGALAVDRQKFSDFIEQKLRSFSQLEIIYEEKTSLPDGPVIVAAGPLVSDSLSETIAKLTGVDRLFFHDAIAPIVDADSINMDVAFLGSRYGKGSPDDYLNCPFTKEQYEAFYEELVNAKLHPLKDFEEEKLFSGCMPIESMARSGKDTIRFGPLKPVGLDLPDGGRAYAVVQLRKENLDATMYNLVGFQTRLNHGEQLRVFRMIPGLENAEFLRLGSMHRNTYINAPLLLDKYLRLKELPRVRFAGQITGVEGYVESAACGLLAGIFAACEQSGSPMVDFPRCSALGSLLLFTQTPRSDYQPSNINFGLMPPLEHKVRDKKERGAQIAHRALQAIDDLCPLLPASV